MILESIEKLQDVRGIPFPARVKYRQLIVTGPPGSGKSSLISKIGGWPEEGYIDLILNHWWRAQSLSLRPREVHLGFPFVGFDDALTVFEDAWLNASEPPVLDLQRILLPPKKKFFFSPDWRSRFVFEFLLPPPEKILAWRQTRAHKEVHPGDAHVTLEQVERQAAVYREAAGFFKRSGILTYVRDDFEGLPKDIVDPPVPFQDTGSP